MGVIVGPDGAVTVSSRSEYAAVRETLSEVTRQMEDLRWVNLSTERPALDLTYDDRKRALATIRLFRRRSPLAKQGANLLQHYVLGKGINLKANNRAVVARLIDEFWEDPVNLAAFTSHQAQKESIDGLFTDGDRFVVMFPDTTEGTLHLGHLDSMFVEDIINDPDNSKVPLWYKCRKPKVKYDFANGSYENSISTDFSYYRDWRNNDPDSKGPKPPKRMIEDGLIYHAAINRRGKFGESELAASVDWLKAHKDFMEDRATLNRAAAQIAWKKKRKGSANDITNEVNRMQSSMVSNIGRYEHNPPPGAGSTIVENEGSSIEWVKTDTGGANALSDERILRMMAGSGMGGIPNHYFGDEAAANLATATAMELPLLKAYEDWQKLWGDIVNDIVGFFLATAHEAGRLGERDDSAKYAERVTTPRKVLDSPSAVPSGGAANLAKPGAASAPADLKEAAGAGAKMDPALQLTLMNKTEPVEDLQVANDKTGKIDWFVDVDFPPILSKDIEQTMTALKTLYELLPAGNIESQKLVAEIGLGVMGENNLDELMERLFPADATPEELQGLPEPVEPTGAMAGLVAAVQGQYAADAQAKQGGAPAAVAESLAEYRVRRVLRAAREASDALVAVGS